MFTGVDGKSLNINNYSELLFGDNLSYTLNMADLNGNLLSPNVKTLRSPKQKNSKVIPSKSVK